MRGQTGSLLNQAKWNPTFLSKIAIAISINAILYKGGGHLPYLEGCISGEGVVGI